MAKAKKSSARSTGRGKTTAKKRIAASPAPRRASAARRRPARTAAALGLSQFDRPAMAEEIVIIASETASDLASLLGSFQDHGVNLKAICIPEASGMGIFRILADPHEAALRVLRSHEIPFQTCPVLAIELGDQPGALGRIFAMLAKAQVSLRHVYGSVGSWGGPALLVIQIDDPAAAARALTT